MEHVIHCVLLRRNASFDDEAMLSIQSSISERGTFRFLHAVSNAIVERPIGNVSYDDATGELTADLHLQDEDLYGYNWKG